MTSTILATFDSVEDANDAIHELMESGFDRSDIGLAMFDRDNVYHNYTADGEDVTPSEGGSFGGKLGMILGAVVGLGAITIPGIGPIIAAGPLAGALGAVTGGAIGAAAGVATGNITASLIDLGVPETEAGYYAESLRRGSALVSVNVYDTDADRATSILRSFNPVDLDKRVSHWREQGWKGYDPNADPYTDDDLSRFEQNRPVYDMDEQEEYDEYAGAVRRYPRS